MRNEAESRSHRRLDGGQDTSEYVLIMVLLALAFSAGIVVWSRSVEGTYDGAVDCFSETTGVAAAAFESAIAAADSALAIADTVIVPSGEDEDSEEEGEEGGGGDGSKTTEVPRCELRR